jgi:hypothetical protein
MIYKILENPLPHISCIEVAVIKQEDGDRKMVKRFYKIQEWEENKETEIDKLKTELDNLTE